MGKLGQQALMYAENLTLPSFQVIVISANLGCDCCRQRVSQIMSKLTGVTEYTVDVQNKQVVAKSDVNFSYSRRRRRNVDHSPRNKINHVWLSFKFSIRFLRPTCCITRCFV
ncbi:hypothetical protein RHSIM_Rhsim07G0108100 [Rhododendron simsii]|uniref:HMA domain-containing protein n=1 Tax=Rhododendron simsii TaxID=118357 RepID=A0A834LJZ9_RHOSS|nr:hypothetical protein RHSIM_Rhsim07G0108100 [Rhododendron simsii]